MKNSDSKNTVHELKGLLNIYSGPVSQVIKNAIYTINDQQEKLDNSLDRGKLVIWLETKRNEDTRLALQITEPSISNKHKHYSYVTATIAEEIGRGLFDFD